MRYLIHNDQSSWIEHNRLGRHTWRRLIILICISASIGLNGCEANPSIQQSTRQLESQHEAISSELIFLENKINQLRAQIQTLEKEDNHLAITANVFGGMRPDKPLATDSETQDRALNRLKSSWNDLANKLLPGNAVDGELAALNHKHSELLQEAQNAARQKPDRITALSLKYRTTPANAHLQTNSPAWSLARTIFSTDFLPLWLVLVVSSLSLWAVIQNDFRLRYRARRRMVVNAWKFNVTSTARSIMQLVWISRYHVCAFVFFVIALISLSSPRPSQTSIIENYQHELKQEVNDLNKSVNTSRDRIELLTKKLHQISQQRKDKLNSNSIRLVNRTVGPSTTETKRSQKDVRKGLNDTHNAIASHLNESLQLVSHIKENDNALKRLAMDAEKEKEELIDFYDLTSQHEWRLLYGKIALLALFTFANLGLLVHWKRQTANRKFQKENVCPRCLRHNSFGLNTEAAQLSSGKDRKLVQCANCGYKVDLADSAKPRIRIPTVGYTESGKTVWRAMFHRIVQRGGALNFNLSLVHKASPNDNVDRDIDEILQPMLDIQKDREMPPFTKPDEPLSPLLYAFSENKKPFPADALLNLFDLAGELGSDAWQDTESQKQAFRGNQGFLYFVDPTLEGEKSKQRQFEQLSYFCGNLYPRPKTHRFAPIAVCISKIDDLEQSGHGNSFLTELITGDTNQGDSIDELVRRHELCRKYQSQLFPGWELNNIFTQLCGGGFLFFPISSLGIGDQSADIGKRNIKPYGVTEPLLWLLHMNGYTVF